MIENLELKQNFGIDAEYELILLLSWNIMKSGGAASFYEDRIYGPIFLNMPFGLWNFKNHLGEITEQILFIR